ncbi:5-oxoprolinase subunit PxpB [Aridibaculum aurantiacum]|uniref:5-oxoprolinase subunit PxpB n=1 Tax=Aridibaculum aurantiacum TaxID=2810307 RepID=UPI001A969176|nr:5-oxoprolinase subunit PxpB [Aridibaculum aurantiacum]
MIESRYTISPTGDSAISISFGNTVDEVLNHKVMHLFHFLLEQKPWWVLDVILAYASLTVVYDLSAVKSFNGSSAFSFVHHWLQQAVEQVDVKADVVKQVLPIPVCYHPSLAPDLELVAAFAKASIEEVIHLHTSRIYTVYMIGFLPGFAYMGKVHEQIAAPRLATPRTAVPAGSVGIAGMQTGIYPLPSPGGWNIIGQTPLVLFNKNGQQPCCFQPGDKVQFQAISIEEYKAFQQP